MSEFEVGGKMFHGTNLIRIEMDRGSGYRSLDLDSLAIVVRDDEMWRALCKMIANGHRKQVLTGLGASDCEICGVAVLNRDVHSKWHETTEGSK